MADPNVELRETFSYVEPCLRAWELSRSLRKLGINGESLVMGEDTNDVIPPTLPNIKANYALLKGFTQHMANTGVIITKLIGYIQPPVVKFYELMEIDVTTCDAKAVIYATSFIIKKMLHVVRRKWARWEMPRELQYHFGIWIRLANGPTGYNCHNLYSCFFFLTPLLGQARSWSCLGHCQGTWQSSSRH